MAASVPAGAAISPWSRIGRGYTGWWGS